MNVDNLSSSSKCTSVNKNIHCSLLKFGNVVNINAGFLLLELLLLEIDEVTKNSKCYMYKSRWLHVMSTFFKVQLTCYFVVDNI